MVVPNQGLIQPGTSQTIEISLGKVQKANLLQIYQLDGPDALEQQSKENKFLIQSILVDATVALSLQNDDEKLTEFWTNVKNNTTTSENIPDITLQKLNVKFIVDKNELLSTNTTTLDSSRMDSTGSATEGTGHNIQSGCLC
jgi:hypothetical protein